MPILRNTTCLLIVFLFCTAGVNAHALQSKDQATDQLQQLQSQYRKQLESAERKINQKIKSTQNFAMSDDKPKISMYFFEGLENELSRLSDDFQEKRLRIEVLDRILFAIEKKFNGGDLRQFLEVQLLQLAQRELMSANPDQRIWKYLLYQSVAIREIAPVQTEVASFVETYMNFSSVSTPKMPQEYLEQSHYGHVGFSESITETSTKTKSQREKIKIKLESAFEKLVPPAPTTIKTSSVQKGIRI